MSKHKPELELESITLDYFDHESLIDDQYVWKLWTYKSYAIGSRKDVDDILGFTEQIKFIPDFGGSYSISVKSVESAIKLVNSFETETKL